MVRGHHAPQGNTKNEGWNVRVKFFSYVSTTKTVDNACYRQSELKGNGIATHPLKMPCSIIKIAISGGT